MTTWVGVSGSWRHAPPGLQDAVHREVAAALAAGKGIVTGGALGVDFLATQTALSVGPQRLKVILPTSLATYCAHYRRRAAEGVISAQQAADLISQLETVARAGSLVEHPERPQVVNVAAYYLRNQDVVDVAGELLAFQVNASSGTQDTVDKARLKGIPVTVFTYQSCCG
jgi:DNA recombination-mediator protein A